VLAVAGQRQKAVLVDLPALAKPAAVVIQLQGERRGPGATALIMVIIKEGTIAPRHLVQHPVHPGFEGPGDFIHRQRRRLQRHHQAGHQPQNQVRLLHIPLPAKYPLSNGNCFVINKGIVVGPAHDQKPKTA